MMTYDQARVSECMRMGIGASFGEIMRLLEWPRDRVVKPLAELGQKGWSAIRLVDGVAHFYLTEAGETAYQSWSEIPF